MLAGTGLSWQSGKTYEVRAGDTIVHRVAEEDHTLIAGPDGLDVLAFGERTNATASYLTRAGVLRMDATVKVAEDRHPWDLEADAGELELPEPSPRPSNIVNRDERRGRARRQRCDLASAAGSERTGLNWVALPPGEEGAPPHCHSLEEEIFVVLDGSGVLELVADAAVRSALSPDVEKEMHQLRAGHVVSRPAGDQDRALLPCRRRDVHVPRLRHSQAERHLLLPALEQDQLPRRRHHRAPGETSTTTTASRTRRLGGVAGAARR